MRRKGTHALSLSPTNLKCGQNLAYYSAVGLGVRVFYAPRGWYSYGPRLRNRVDRSMFSTDGRFCGTRLLKSPKHVGPTRDDFMLLEIIARVFPCDETHLLRT